MCISWSKDGLVIYFMILRVMMLLFLTFQSLSVIRQITKIFKLLTCSGSLMLMKFFSLMIGPFL
jgi:hypothetical protein